MNTTVSGPFTGCTKGQSYQLADGSKFVCSESRTAFAVNPKALLLESSDGTVDALLIDGIAYSGGLTRLRAGAYGSPIATSTEAPEALKASHPSSAIGAVRPVEALMAIVPMRDIASLRDEAVQEYPPASGRQK